MMLGSKLIYPDGLLTEQPSSKLPPRQSLSNRLLLCEVHDVIAYGHAYIVKGVGTPRMVAVMGSLSGSMLPVGARDAFMLVPGALVVCWISETFVPVILAVLATPMGAPELAIPDSIVACGHAGMFADKMHQDVVTNRTDSNGLFDFSAGRPIDNIPGDWGKFNELGMGVFLGKLMTFLRASDACKLEMFYEDHLARLAAYNLQLYTAGSEMEAFNDQGEWSSIEGYNPYPWEALGSNDLSQLPLSETPYDELNPNAVAKGGKKMGYEPSNALQTGWWRFRTFKGYLGDLRRRLVLLPNFSNKTMVYGTDAGKYAKPTTPAYLGVLEERIGIDGSYRLRSAKNIIFEKTAWIEVPEELMPRDHPDGDTDFTNAAGRGTTLEEFPADSSPAEAELKAQDRRAYELKKLQNQGFNLRLKDWRTKDDPPKMPGDFQTEEPGFMPYGSFEAPEPESTVQKVDHRRQSRYYKGKAKIGFTDDGGVVLEDGYGSSIKLLAGNIEITCPGDILMRNGRDVQVWAGRDTIVKSQDDIDISSSKSDVRIKSERNLMMLGGNCGVGGVLIENRGAGAPDFTDTESLNIGGLFLKCSRGTLGFAAATLYLRSSSGPVILDANDGKQDVILFGRSFDKFLRSGSLEVVAANEIMETTPVQNLSIIQHRQGSLTITDGTVRIGATALYVTNPLPGTDGRVFTQLQGTLDIVGSGRATSGFTARDRTPTDTYNRESLVEIHRTSRSDSLELLTDMATIYLRDDTAIGSPTVIGNMGVRFRSSDELNLNTFKICEAPWQKRFRRTMGGEADAEYPGAAFEERDVYPRVNDAGVNEGIPTMPFPGKSAWDTGTFFVRYDDVFYQMDASGGKPIPRGEDIDESYDLEKLKDPEFGQFKDRYPVNS